MGLYDALKRFALSNNETPCPECQQRLRDEHDGPNVPEAPAMEKDHVRDPRTQTHWRGVEALVCPQCGYAERAEDPAVSDERRTSASPPWRE